MEPILPSAYGMLHSSTISPGLENTYTESDFEREKERSVLKTQGID